MKNMKKILALLVAAMILVASMSVAFADPAEKTIKINGLEAGDTVKYYKVIEWASDGSGWKFVAPFNTLLSADQQKEITGYVKEEGGKKTVVSGKITDTTATIMGGANATALNGNGDTVGENETSWSVGNLAAGLYMALITGAAPDAQDGETMHVYNPVFLAVQSDNAGTELTLPLNYADNGTAKKSDITVDKKAKNAAGEWDDHTSENVGDIIEYKVETTVPAYLESWTNPVFTVTDTLSDGLTFAVGENNALTTITLSGATTGSMTEGTQYEVEKDASHFVITFKDTYLKGREAAEVVTILYSAKITADAKTVNPEDNTVKIDYSRNPKDANDHGTKEDKTTHYTFSIDAELFGDQNYESSELIKIGVDEAGNVITTTETTYDNGEKHMPLEGAEFKLFKADGTTPYTNSGITADTVFVSNSEGKLMVKNATRVGIHGLEEGTYVLKETKAPTGYMLMTESVTFVIKAEYEEVAATETCNAYKQLKSYTVKVNNQETSTYQMDNGASTKVIKKDGQGHAGDVGHEIKNVQGVSLPSTGGIGTTLFYIGGGILVLAAVILLVTKRRMNAND